MISVVFESSGNGPLLWIQQQEDFDLFQSMGTSCLNCLAIDTKGDGEFLHISSVEV